MTIVRFVVWLLLPVLASPAMARPADPATAVVRDLCGKRVALLGENGEHGSGATLAFKAELVHRLVTRCGFRAVMFEANRYQFIAFERSVAAGNAAVAGLKAAVGDLWARYTEFGPLAAFLTAEASAGRVRLAGLDDGVGVRHATFANDTMIGELTGLLPPGRARECDGGLRARVDWDHASPSYGLDQRARLRACVAEMKARVAADDDRTALLAALDRMLARDLLPSPEQFAGRERTMDAAFEEVMATLPRGTKVIVWGATAHLARDSSTWPPLPNSPSFGALVHRRYGGDAFTLGLSALGGSWRRTPGRPATPWSTAPAGAIEARVLPVGRADAYLDRRALGRLGPAPARIWNDPFVTTRWDRVVDGLIVFRTDRPPTLSS